VSSMRSNEAQPDGNGQSGIARCRSTEMAAKLAISETCPKWTRCGATFCPALGPVFGGKPYEGERVCSYLLESVKEGGPQRLRGCLPKDLV
jgi:hypothetical protein